MSQKGNRMGSGNSKPKSSKAGTKTSYARSGAASHRASHARRREQTVSGIRRPETEMRLPAQRLRQPSGTRPMWDQKHPGPIFSEIIPTHICLEWPLELEYDPTHPLVIEREQSQSDASTKLMFYRIANAERVIKRNPDPLDPESKNDFVWAPDFTTPIGSLVDQTITLKDLETNLISEVQVVEWYRKTPIYKSGQCVIRMS